MVKRHEVQPLPAQMVAQLTKIIDEYGYGNVMLFLGFRADAEARGYAHLLRKVAHGCTDASCHICDKEQW